MALNTRLDSRSEDNSTLAVKDGQGNIIAVVACKSGRAELAITTAQGLHVEKPNGFSSRKE